MPIVNCQQDTVVAAFPLVYTTRTLHHRVAHTAAPVVSYLGILLFILFGAMLDSQPFDSVLTRTLYETTTMRCWCSLVPAIIIIHIGTFGTALATEIASSRKQIREFNDSTVCWFFFSFIKFCIMLLARQPAGVLGWIDFANF